MQYGTVNDALEASVTLTILADNGTAERHEFFIDTGFYGELTLPQSIIDRLDLPVSRHREVDLTLAGGTNTVSNTYRARIWWHGRPENVEVVSLENDFLLGMGLLQGSNLNVDAVPAGAVVISELGR